MDHVDAVTESTEDVVRRLELGLGDAIGWAQMCRLLDDNFLANETTVNFAQECFQDAVALDASVSKCHGICRTRNKELRRFQHHVEAVKADSVGVATQNLLRKNEVQISATTSQKYSSQLRDDLMCTFRDNLRFRTLCASFSELVTEFTEPLRKVLQEQQKVPTSRNDLGSAGIVARLDAVLCRLRPWQEVGSMEAFREVEQLLDDCYHISTNLSELVQGRVWETQQNTGSLSLVAYWSNWRQQFGQSVQRLANGQSFHSAQTNQEVVTLQRCLQESVEAAVRRKLFFQETFAEGRENEAADGLANHFEDCRQNFSAGVAFLESYEFAPDRGGSQSLVEMLLGKSDEPLDVPSGLAGEGSPTVRRLREDSGHREIRLLSYNLFIRPPAPMLTHNRVNDHKDSRLSRFIRDHLARYDVLCLQECFGAYSFRRDRLIEAAKAVGIKYSVKSVLNRPYHLVDGGCLLLSRFPIVAHDVKVFDVAGLASDSVAAKGVLVARIEYRPGVFLDVVTTHLQATYANYMVAECLQIRLNQLREVVAFTRKQWASHDGARSWPVLVAGDFNCNARRAYNDSSSSDEYNLVTSVLRDLGNPRDLVFEFCGYHPPTYSDTYDDAGLMPKEQVLTAPEDCEVDQTRQRLDFVFWFDPEVPGPGGVFQPTFARVNEFEVDRRVDVGAPVTHLSDHFGIECGFVFESA
mmetsp:Transcript_48450/g.110022  ORF Transcript_48450/g.110022 Transcript_48450/m.110022 type:complete len:694 (-) Transcript_48450:27-2108(-)